MCLHVARQRFIIIYCGGGAAQTYRIYSCHVPSSLSLSLSLSLALSLSLSLCLSLSLALALALSLSRSLSLSPGLPWSTIYFWNTGDNMVSDFLKNVFMIFMIQAMEDASRLRGMNAGGYGWHRVKLRSKNIQKNMGDHELEL